MNLVFRVQCFYKWAPASSKWQGGGIRSATTLPSKAVFSPPDLLEASGGGKMSPVLEVLSMKSSNLLENKLRKESSRVVSLVLVEPLSPALPELKKRKLIDRWFFLFVDHRHDQALSSRARSEFIVFSNIPAAIYAHDFAQWTQRKEHEREKKVCHGNISLRTRYFARLHVQWPRI